MVLRRLLLLATSIALLGAADPKVGGVAPAYELTLMDGNKVTSDELRGQVVVLNFWATWCVPCREELPLLDAYYNRQRGAGLRVFAIATEGSVPAYRMKNLFAAMHIAPVRRIRGQYEIIGGLPTNYIIDRAGRVRYAKAGAFTLDTLNKELVPLLRESRPAS